MIVILTTYFLKHQFNLKYYTTFLLIMILQPSFGQDDISTFLFAGSYTDGKIGAGIHVYKFDNVTGHLEEVEKKEDLINASFVSLSPNGQYLYACTETKLDREGSVSAFKIDTITGSLSFLNKQPSGGRNPVHINTDRGDDYVVNANFTDAGLSIFEVDHDGSLKPYSQLIEFEGSSVTKRRQDKAHLHATYFSPDGKYLFAMDLGTDKIHSFEFDDSNVDRFVSMDNSSFTKVIGSGPRHFTFHPNHKLGYSINEINGTVSGYLYSEGKLTPNGVHFSYSQEYERYQSGDIHISPDGAFLYASNRGDDENSLSIFSIISSDGTFNPIGHQSTFGIHPRSFVIDPTGHFLLVANQASGNIVVF